MSGLLQVNLDLFDALLAFAIVLFIIGGVVAWRTRRWAAVFEYAGLAVACTAFLFATP